MPRWTLLLSSLLLALGFAGCEVRTCDPDEEDCGIGDDDGGPDADTDVDADCDYESWENATDDTCDDATTLRTCADGDVFDLVDCMAECGGSGACGTHPRGGFACVCEGPECDYESWENATDNTCASDTEVRTCAPGDAFALVDCVEECQAAYGRDGVCATLSDPPGYGCVCGTGDTCELGTPDTCIDDDIVQRCIAGLVIQESCQNWCEVENGEDGLCNEDVLIDTCQCY